MALPSRRGGGPLLIHQPATVTKTELHDSQPAGAEPQAAFPERSFPLLCTTEIYVSRGGWHTSRDDSGQI